MQSDEARRQLYQMMAAQLQHDGFYDAARVVSRSTMVTTLSLNNDPTRLLSLTNLGLHAEAVGMTGGYMGRETYRSLPTVETHVSETAPITDERWSRFAEKYNVSYKQPVRTVAYSADGLLSASGCGDGMVRINDVPAMHQRYLRHEDTSLCRLFHDHTQAVHTVAFHPTLPWLVSGGREGKIFIYDYTRPGAASKPLRTVEDTHAVRGLLCHPGGRHILYTVDHPTIRFYDIEKSQLLTLSADPQHRNSVWDIACSNDGRRFASASADGSLKVFDGVTGGLVADKGKAHSGSDVTSVMFSRTGDYLLSSGRDGQAILWDLRKYHTAVRTFGVHQRLSHRPTAKFLFREDVVVATNDQDDTVVTSYEVRSQQPLSRMVHPASVRGLATSPVEQTFLSGTDDFGLRLWGSAL